MKYIDVEKLKEEIERRRKFHDDAVIKFCNNRTIALTHSAGLKEDEELLSFIDSLQQEQPSLPDNLDESAREIVIKMHPCLKDCTILGDRLTRGQLMALVKAGAEWMAKQINNDN